jgi:hypothetical protein
MCLCIRGERHPQNHIDNLNIHRYFYKYFEQIKRDLEKLSFEIRDGQPQGFKH